MISSPGWAGRQWSAIAFGAAQIEQFVVEPVRRERPPPLGRRLAGRRSCSPTRRCRRASAPRAASRRIVGQDAGAVGLELVAVRRGDADLDPRLGAQHDQRARHVVAVADVGERRALRARRTSRAGSSGLRAPGTGGGSGVSMLITGTVACSASSSTSWSSPVRIPIAATWRERTYAVSRTDSPRVSWRSSVRSTIGYPPSSVIPASNDTRVRVEGFWKISATERLRSTSELYGAALSSSARSIRRSARPRSAPTR